MGIKVLLEESFEEGAAGRQDHLVSTQLATILSGQGHIGHVCVKPKIFEGFWTFLLKSSQERVNTSVMLCVNFDKVPMLLLFGYTNYTPSPTTENTALSDWRKKHLPPGKCWVSNWDVSAANFT